MVEDVEMLLTLLTDSSPEVSEKIRKIAAFAAHTLLHSWQHLLPEQKQSIKNLLLRAPGHSSSYKGAMVASMLFSITGEEKHLKQAVDYLRDYEPDLASGAASYFSLALMDFQISPVAETAINKYITRSVLRDLFLKNTAKTQEIFDLVCPDGAPAFKRNNRVIILTRQMLKPPHAPSVDTLDFAAMLQAEYGKETLILVTSEASRECDGAIAPSYLANMDTDFIPAKHIDYKGQCLPFHMCGEGTLSNESMAQGLATIAAYNPEMVLSVGGPTLMAEPFADSRFCFMYPTGRGIPLIVKSHFHTWDEPDETMLGQIQAENLMEKHLFHQHPGFGYKPPSSSISRAQFGIPEDAFVFVVVGLRLNHDIDDSFVELLDKITAHDKAHIIFAGPFDDYDSRMKGYVRLKEKSTPLGFQPDIMAVYNISDAFLNPTRKGAGSGIIYAMQALLPILSLPHGDAGLAAAGFPPLGSYEEMEEAARRLIDDPETLQSYKATAAAEFPKFTGRTQLMARIMEEFEKYAARVESENKA